MLSMIIFTCVLSLASALCQKRGHVLAPVCWGMTAVMCAFLIYWHGEHVNEFRENTLQTLVWTMAGILAFLMSLCSQADIQSSRVLHRKGQHSFMARYVFIAVMIVVLCLVGVFPETKNIKSFMLTFLPTKLFFWSRPVSAGLCLFGAAGFFSIYMLRQGSLHVRRIFCQSRDAAMLGGLVFIGGEICGSFWSLCGWGSTWRWSGNFYGSAATFLLLMVGMHMPSKVFGMRVPRSLLSGLIYFVAGSAVVFGKLG